MSTKPKVAFYWCASCGGCEETVVDLNEDVLKVVDAVDIVLWPVHFTLHYVGFSVLPPFVTFSVQGGISYTEESEMLAELEKSKARFRDYLTRIADAKSVEPIRFNGWDDWDTEGRLRPGAEGHSPFVRKSASR